MRSESVRSHLGKNLGSPATELLRRERAHAKRTHTAEMGPPASELRLLLPGNSWCRRRGKKASSMSKKQLRILSKPSPVTRVGLKAGENGIIHRPREGRRILHSKGKLR